MMRVNKGRYGSFSKASAVPSLMAAIHIIFTGAKTISSQAGRNLLWRSWHGWIDPLSLRLKGSAWEDGADQRLLLLAGLTLLGEI
jgi:hypothetical protein